MPIVNSKLDENMEFAHSPSNLFSSAKPASALGRRHRGELQISNRPAGGEPGIAAPTRCPTSLGEAGEAEGFCHPIKREPITEMLIAGTKGRVSDGGGGQHGFRAVSAQ